MLFNANAYITFFKSDTSYLIPLAYASSKVLNIMSIDDFVDGIISFFKCLDITVRIAFSFFNPSNSITLFSFFKGSPEFITDTCSLLHLVKRRLNDELPLNTFTSMFSE